MPTPPFLYDDLLILDYDQTDISYDGDNMENVIGTGNGVWAWYQGGAPE